MKKVPLSIFVATAFTLVACGGSGSVSPLATDNSMGSTGSTGSVSGFVPITSKYTVPANLAQAVATAKQGVTFGLHPDDFSSDDKIERFQSTTVSNGKTYDTAKQHLYSGVIDHRLGYYIGNVSEKVRVKGTISDDEKGTRAVDADIVLSGQEVIYNLPYVIMAGRLPQQISGRGLVNGKVATQAELEKDTGVGLFEVWDIAGYMTPRDFIDNTLKPNNVVAEYKGKAFGNVNKTMLTGDLSYTIDFGRQTGKGVITGVGDKVALESGKLIHYNSGNNGLAGKATWGGQDGYDYHLSIFGPQAENIMGGMSQGDDDVMAFGGEKQ